MRVALSTGVLSVPPTYFVVDHARRLQATHEFELFTLAADISDPGIDMPVHDIVPFRRLPFSIRMRAAPLFLPSMAPAMVEFQPDIIHQHFGTWCAPATIASRRIGVPMITTLHGYDVRIALNRPRTVMERWHVYNVHLAQEHSTRVLAVSQYLAELAIRAGFEASLINVHYQGVDTDFFCPSDEVTDSDELPIVIFVGSFSRLKGVSDLVLASRTLQEETPHRLVLIGDGPLTAGLRRNTASDEHIEILGRLDRINIRALLRRARVAVLPTQEYKGDREAAGLALLEAQACGTPVVAYDSGGTPEMLTPNETGLLVAEKDVRALTIAIRDILLLSATEYDAMSRAARNFSVSERSLNASSDQLLQYYDAVTQ